MRAQYGAAAVKCPNAMIVGTRTAGARDSAVFMALDTKIRRREAPAGRGDEKRPLDLVGNQKSIAGFRKNYSVTVDHPADKRAAAD